MYNAEQTSKGKVIFDEMSDDSNCDSDAHPIYMGKTDVQSTFRVAPLFKASWAWLIMKAENPITGKIQYFVDKCLPFGASISCALFQEISDVLKFIIEFRTKSKKTVTNYLDDFLFLAYTLNRCNYLIAKFLKLCSEVGVPISEEKTEWATTRIVFLGMLLDRYWMLICVLEEKRVKVMNMLQLLINKKKSTVKQLQELCGFLNLLNRAQNTTHN